MKKAKEIITEAEKKAEEIVGQVKKEAENVRKAMLKMPKLKQKSLERNFGKGRRSKNMVKKAEENAEKLKTNTRKISKM
nr:hypothetical protein [Candidatus Baldrarchaeota archaeon]